MSVRFKHAVQRASLIRKLTGIFNYIWRANIFISVTQEKGSFISIKARRGTVRK